MQCQWETSVSFIEKRSRGHKVFTQLPAFFPAFFPALLPAFLPAFVHAYHTYTRSRLVFAPLVTCRFVCLLPPRHIWSLHTRQTIFIKCKQPLLTLFAAPRSVQSAAAAAAVSAEDEDTSNPIQEEVCYYGSWSRNVLVATIKGRIFRLGGRADTHGL